MKLTEALPLAEKIVAQLAPHCERIEIAGSIRRKVPVVGNIQIVCIPKPYENKGMFVTGVASVINQWTKITGELPCKETRRMLPETIPLDVNFVTPENWGYIFAIKTGSANFSHLVLGKGWVKAGYQGIDGTLYRAHDKKPMVCLEEKDFFKLIGVKYIEPEGRGLTYT